MINDAKIPMKKEKKNTFAQILSWLCLNLYFLERIKLLVISFLHSVIYICSF